ncbi:hypothetical protein [Pseudomonas izuensis]|uniref:hypothetical protein n=1 Tax=Pseudomonas izuensis TaxID=2684212 RepID=UPI00135B478E|nr:hypothetical protein [Pseudomonas izuensis]
MIKFGTERPAETVYPTLYDEFEISKRPYWSPPGARKKTTTTASVSAFIQLFRLSTWVKPAIPKSNRPVEVLDSRTSKP